MLIPNSAGGLANAVGGLLRCCEWRLWRWTGRFAGNCVLQVSSDLWVALGFWPSCCASLRLADWCCRCFWGSGEWIWDLLGIYLFFRDPLPCFPSIVLGRPYRICCEESTRLASGRCCCLGIRTLPVGGMSLAWGPGVGGDRKCCCCGCRAGLSYWQGKGVVPRNTPSPI